MSLCVGDRQICRSERKISFATCIPDGHLHRVTYTRYCIDKIDPPDDEHKVARNMKRVEINIYKVIVRQVGYLLELYRDAWSPQHIYIKGVPGGTCQTSGGCSLC